MLDFFSLQNGRPTQDDSFFVLATDQLVVLAVADGFTKAESSGAAVARTVSQAIRTPGVLRPLERLSRENYEAVFRKVFSAIHDLTRRMKAGATLALACIRSDAVYAAALGDSSVVFSADDVGSNHVPFDENRHKMGSELWGCFGDVDNAAFHSAIPVLACWPLENGTLSPVVIVASDGLYPCASWREVARHSKQYMAMIRAGRTAEVVVREAVARGSKDNVTALIWSR